MSLANATCAVALQYLPHAERILPKADALALEDGHSFWSDQQLCFLLPELHMLAALAPHRYKP